MNIGNHVQEIPLSELSHVQNFYNLTPTPHSVNIMPSPLFANYSNPYLMPNFNSHCEYANRRLQNDLEINRRFSSLLNICPPQLNTENDLYSQNKESNTREWISNNFIENNLNQNDLDTSNHEIRLNSDVNDNSEQWYSRIDEDRNQWSTIHNTPSQRPFTKAGAWVTFNNV